jgi:hypothetical protein
LGPGLPDSEAHDEERKKIMRNRILAALAAVALLTGVACDKKSPTGPGDEPKYSLALLTVEVRNIKDDKPVQGYCVEVDTLASGRTPLGSTTDTGVTSPATLSVPEEWENRGSPQQAQFWFDICPGKTCGGPVSPNLACFKARAGSAVFNWRFNQLLGKATWHAVVLVEEN